MNDYIIRATAADGTVRAFAAVTTNMVAKAKELHNMSPLATVAMGRTMTVTAMMSKMLKNKKDTITVQIRSDGPLGGIVTVADSFANVRGYVYNPQVYLPLNQSGKFDVARAVGENGYLSVIRDIGLKEPYIGYVKLATGEIGDDIAYYFAFSEQIPSSVGLGVLIDRDESVLASGGFIVQLMPGAEEELIQHIESKISVMPPVTSMLSDGKKPEDILEFILGEKELKIIDTSNCSFSCNCSRERMERNLLTLGRDEIAEIIEQQHGAEIQCHFCNSRYFFTEEELRKLIGE